VGEPPRRELFEQAGELATEDETLEPPDDLHASAEYRRNVAGVLVEQILIEASDSAGITVGS
jgi:CO/xanthine dehydrogenase FAD-binding subunit